MPYVGFQPPFVTYGGREKLEHENHKAYVVSSTKFLSVIDVWYFLVLQ
jgi:hypothetical protein